MSVDYALAFPCEVRKNVPEPKLLVLVGYKSLAEFAIAEIRKAEPALAVETIIDKYDVQVNQTRPDGTTTQSPMTIRQLLALAQPLAPYREHCTQCRANIADRAFGCFARINYPIRKETEEWLLSRLPADSNDPDLSTLFRLLSSFEIDGRLVDKQRARLCELQQPLIRRWASADRQHAISSSQLLQMLAFVGNIEPDQAVAYTRVLKLATVLSERHVPSSSIEQFKTFMCAVVMSGRLKAGIVVDA
jgi:hypothetical protein